MTMIVREGFRTPALVFGFCVLVLLLGAACKREDQAKRWIELGRPVLYQSLRSVLLYEALQDPDRGRAYALNARIHEALGAAQAVRIAIGSGGVSDAQSALSYVDAVRRVLRLIPEDLGSPKLEDARGYLLRMLALADALGLDEGLTGGAGGRAAVSDLALDDEWDYEALEREQWLWLCGRLGWPSDEPAAPASILGARSSARPGQLAQPGRRYVLSLSNASDVVTAAQSIGAPVEDVVQVLDRYRSEGAPLTLEDAYRGAGEARSRDAFFWAASLLVEASLLVPSPAASDRL